MPLFILISGFFSKHHEDIRELWKSLLPLFIVFIVFQFINLFAVFVISGKVLSLQYLVTPYWILWYLLSLLFWRVMLNSVPKKLLNKPILSVALATIVAVFSGLMFVNGRVLSIQRTLNFFPFFLFGYYLKQGVFKKKLWQNKVSWMIIGVVLLLIIVNSYNVRFVNATFFISIEKAKILLRGADHYTINDVPMKLCFLLCSFVLSMSIYYLLPESKFLSYIGRDSMLYYLYHGLIIQFLLLPLVKHYHLPQTFLFVLLYWIMVVGFIFLVGKVKPLRWLTSPLKSRKK